MPRRPLRCAGDIGTKQVVGPERDVRGFSVGREHDRFLTDRAADDICQPVRGFDRHVHASAGDIAFDQHFNPAPVSRMRITAGQGIERIPDQLHHRSLAGAPRADETVPAVGQFKLGPVQETSHDRHVRGKPLGPILGSSRTTRGSFTTPASIRPT